MKTVATKHQYRSRSRYRSGGGGVKVNSEPLVGLNHVAASSVIKSVSSQPFVDFTLLRYNHTTILLRSAV